MELTLREEYWTDTGNSISFGFLFITFLRIRSVATLHVRAERSCGVNIQTEGIISMSMRMAHKHPSAGPYTNLRNQNLLCLNRMVIGIVTKIITVKF
jgi:fructose-specific phosphotransferase system IIC component